MNFQPLLLILSTSLISISYSFVSFYRGFAFLTGVYVKYLLQNRFAFFISLFGLSAILKIRNGEHAHYVGLVVAYTWNREKQMFVALGKGFDMKHQAYVCYSCSLHHWRSGHEKKFLLSSRFLLCPP